MRNIHFRIFEIAPLMRHCASAVRQFTIGPGALTPRLRKWNVNNSVCVRVSQPPTHCVSFQVRCWFP